MKTLFDTSVLVAAFVETHPKHLVCLVKLQEVKSGQREGVICTHTMAELYSVLTRLPVTPSISCQLAQKLIDENLKEFEIVDLVQSDYQRVINQMVNWNLPGGAIYDALIACAAVKAEVEELLTLNPNHFSRLGSRLAELVRVPT